MTLPSQFSLEEENFYKDIQDLLKNSSQNEKELSSFLQRYMDLLAKADLDDESFIINFTKAGLIIEASAKVYGTKVDRLWNNLEHILMSLRNKGHGQSKNKTLGGEEMEMEVDENRRRLSVNGRRRKKLGDALVSADDFVEIDNITGLLGKNMNEDVRRSSGSLKFCEKVPNMFIKNKQKKKKIDVCLSKNVEEKDIIRLRDWVISTECLLLKEIYTSIPEDNSTNITADESFGLRRDILDDVLNKSGTAPENTEKVGKETVDSSRVELIGTGTPEEDPKGQSLNMEMEVELEKSVKEPTLEEFLRLQDKNNDFGADKDSVENDLNVSKESDLAKFPNVLGRGPKACLVDVDEVFWDAEKFQDMIPNRKLKSGKASKTFNPPCKLCKKKEVHQGKKLGKRCINRKRKDSGLDSYFIPHVQPTIGEPQFGILPDEELFSTFKQENKIIEQLAKLNVARNINEAFHPDENPEQLRNFLGFDGFEKRLMRLSECNEDEIQPDFEGNNPDEEPNFADNPPPGDDFELPVPVTTDLIRQKITHTECDQGPSDDDRLVEFEYQKLLKEGLKDHYEAKSIFAKNKELGIKISKWHEMISDKIRLSEQRGAMNMKSLADQIMTSFPSSIGGDLPRMSFRELVRNQCQRDVPRYFFGCLQLTNEGNLDISRSDPRPLATNCMVITQLRSTRKNCDLDESTARTPTKEARTSEVNRKRNSLMRSPMTFENKSPSKTKRVKQRTEKAYKRQKNFTALNNSKKISNEHEETLKLYAKLKKLNENEKEIQLYVALKEEESREIKNPKRPKRVANLESDLFQEIDFSITLSGEIITESPDESLKKPKFYNNAFRIFIKNHTKKRRNTGDEKIIRLKEWILTAECLLVKEICPSYGEKGGENVQYKEKNAFIDESIVLYSSGERERWRETMSVKSEIESGLVEFSDFRGGKVEPRPMKTKPEEKIAGLAVRFRFMNRDAVDVTVAIKGFSRLGLSEMYESHTYTNKPYRNCKSENLSFVVENPGSGILTPEGNDPGPSDTNMVQLMMQKACKRQENFRPLCHPKKRKY